MYTVLHPPRTPFLPRGDLSGAVLDALIHIGPIDAESARLSDMAREIVSDSPDVIIDDDVQAALFAIYAASYGSLPGIDVRREWDPAIIEVRQVIETGFESALRAAIAVPECSLPGDSGPVGPQVASALFALASEDSGPSLSRYFAKEATRAQAEEFLIQRSIYTLREADPHSWAIPRLRGRPKAALVEIQADEYGGGRPERVHAELYAKAMRGAGLDDTYGAYLDVVPAIVLASHNMMSMFGLNGRLLGSIVGHLAAFEMTSSIPNRFYGDGLRRLGYGEDVVEYFDEHVEADAVHEQIAAHDLAGALAEDRPELLADIMFGAAACLAMDGWAAQHQLEAWHGGRSALRSAA